MTHCKFVLCFSLLFHALTAEQLVYFHCDSASCTLPGELYVTEGTYLVKTTNLETERLTVEQFGQSSCIDLKNLPNVDTIIMKTGLFPLNICNNFLTSHLT